MTATLFRSIEFRSTLFNSTRPRDDAINPMCFGDDVARWLRERLATRGIRCAEPRQEDWGWYLIVEPPSGRDWSITINIGWHGGVFAGRQTPPSEECWTVFLQAGGRSLISRLFGKTDDRVQFAASVGSAIRAILASEEGIEVESDDRGPAKKR